MSIKKSKFNHYKNDTEYDTLHHETQAQQVKILDLEGNIKSNIYEMLLRGKELDSIDIRGIKDTGIYKIKGCTDTPTELSDTETFIMNVITIDDGIESVTVQEIHDHVTHNSFTRSIKGDNASTWDNAGRSILNKLIDIEDNIGDKNSLTTNSKDSLVTAINELDKNTDENTDKISIAQSGLDTLKNDFDNHHHDEIYLKLSGGDMTGNLSLANGNRISGKNTSGGKVDIGRVDSNNTVVLGDVNNRTYIDAKDKELRIYDGKTSVKIFHEDNDGHGSGLDADELDGIQGNRYARRDNGNIFKEDQIVGEGKSLAIRASSGSSQAGSLFFQDGNGSQKARIRPRTNGSLDFYAGKTLVLTAKPDGDTETTHDHILNAKDRQVGVRFKLNDNDKGAGFYINNGSKQVGFYDWEHSDWFFTTDRKTREVDFRKNVKIQGKRLFIQWSAPSSSQVDEGDIWININS
ncbi:hypothetical protein RVS70_05735 [Virgibacillus sp. M23]|uniref:hypothetical protein n=1 Tax=Virgibacillus sp. M23 TaxID=3079030 RepID=UPI002A91F3FE|nr:hypothetical protein [Virgibacillus sp. M23]MDY7043702.1 hypothetical protein [Virgibacillus sp. M23]